MDEGIRADLEAWYGVVCLDSAPVAGGLLNLKWRVDTPEGPLLVKRYSRERFGPDQLARIEAALERQAALDGAAIPCPRLWRRGRILRELPDGTVYMVMDFCPGRTQGPEQTTARQMASLGAACGRMHVALAALPGGCEGPLPQGGYSLPALRASHAELRAQVPPDAPPAYRSALERAGRVIAALPEDFFAGFARGWAHEDFHSGNILLDPGGVTAIVDFDRNAPSFPLHDVGRALLSFALEGGGLVRDKVEAFRQGYARCRPLSRADLAAALRLTWCIEMPWWLQAAFFGPCDEVPRRFAAEMDYLAERWDDLEALIGA